MSKTGMWSTLRLSRSGHFGLVRSLQSAPVFHFRRFWSQTAHHPHTSFYGWTILLILFSIRSKVGVAETDLNTDVRCRPNNYITITLLFPEVRGACRSIVLFPECLPPRLLPYYGRPRPLAVHVLLLIIMVKKNTFTLQSIFKMKPFRMNKSIFQYRCTFLYFVLGFIMLDLCLLTRRLIVFWD